MEIVIIGAGNVATVFGRLLLSKGLTVVQVVSRNEHSARTLGVLLNCEAVTSLDALYTGADLYLITVADKAIETLARTLRLGDRLVVHTAGSVEKEVLQSVSSRYGVLYPLQSLRKNMDRLPEIPLFLEGSSKAVEEELQTLAGQLSPKVAVATGEQRLKLHVAAVIVSNFTNYLYTVAEEYCETENIPFDFLTPLIVETTNRLRDYRPSQVQTGPAIRNDEPTLQKHEEILDSYPSVKELYTYLTARIRASKW
jgi:predicted short-subunit dehydrogenase-like oxidoreductase (DUF2520 family)